MKQKTKIKANNNEIGSGKPFIRFVKFIAIDGVDGVDGGDDGGGDVPDFLIRKLNWKLTICTKCLFQ